MAEGRSQADSLPLCLALKEAGKLDCCQESVSIYKSQVKINTNQQYSRVTVKDYLTLLVKSYEIGNQGHDVDEDVFGIALKQHVCEA